ncbi:hypothetical protein Desku_0650 [Desulfofundulus kuznetsovii DSM 6115]|uniref:Uncharacterized protein n=1 Tax=Desulfofundulus kuznetsovii (strain DSM 6115 / VKM B-1805 / 17) TaxID=760568 RepID=A0AAU8PU52_DESK7|nr:hypothetical protein Desku_0650 [Desulfofundulus kuznetsovii DSM 6115]
MTHSAPLTADKMAAVLHEATQHSLQPEFSDGMSADYNCLNAFAGTCTR